MEKSGEENITFESSQQTGGHGILVGIFHDQNYCVLRPGDDAAMFTTLTDPVVMALKQVHNSICPGWTETQPPIWVGCVQSNSYFNLPGFTGFTQKKVRNCLGKRDPPPFNSIIVCVFGVEIMYLHIFQTCIYLVLFCTKTRFQCFCWVLRVVTKVKYHGWIEESKYQVGFQWTSTYSPFSSWLWPPRYGSAYEKEENSFDRFPGAWLLPKHPKQWDQARAWNTGVPWAQFDRKIEGFQERRTLVWCNSEKWGWHRSSCSSKRSLSCKCWTENSTCRAFQGGGSDQQGATD